MSQDSLSFLTGSLCCLGFLVLAFVAYAAVFRQSRSSSGAAKTRPAGWEAFVARRGLEWEVKRSPDDPMMDAIFGEAEGERTGRVVGAYRGYPVVLAGRTRDQLSRASLMVSGQSYFTELRLAIRNPGGIRLRVGKKDGKLSFEPPDVGVHLVGASQTFGRLGQITTPFVIGIERQELRYLQAGLEQNTDRLCHVLDLLCDLADAVGAFGSYPLL